MSRIALPLFILCLLCADFPAYAASPETTPCRMIKTYPHNTQTFTEGLFWADGALFESSGKYGKSFLAKVALETGRHMTRAAIASRFFAEGIAPHDGMIYALTWKSGAGFIVDSNTFARQGTFSYRQLGERREGWGLTSDGKQFILSSGTDELFFYSPEPFTLTGSVKVRDQGKPVKLLNELEWVDGLVYANVWKSDIILIIAPASGEVVHKLDLSPLRELLGRSSGRANGIAYDAENKRLFVTGKYWDKLFEIALPDL